MQLLLAKGADVNLTGGRSGCAPQAALENGHDTVVQLLLTKGVDSNRG